MPTAEEIRAHRGDYELVVNNDNGVWIHTLLLCSTCDGPILVVQEPLPEGDVSEPAQLYPAVRGVTPSSGAVASRDNAPNRV